MLISFRPLDVVSVRDGRPFDVGGVVHARSLWPLSPWTVLGALRTLLCELNGTPAIDYGALRERGKRLPVDDIIGPPDGAPPFCLGPVFAVAHPAGGQGSPRLLLPVPADVVTVTVDGRTSMHRLGALPFPPVEGINGYARSTSCRSVVALPRPAGMRPDKTPAVTVFSREDLDWWLAGGDPPRAATEAAGRSRWRLEDPRIGIAIDRRTGTVEEGRFYIRYTHQLEDGHAIAVTVVEPGPPALRWSHLQGLSLRFGADGHLASIEVDEQADPWPPPADPGADGKAALLFLSPVRPSDIRRLAESAGVAEVLAVIAGRPVRIGGWQLRIEGNRQVGPRPMITYYPAGTVALVKVADRAGFRQLHGRSVAQDDQERAAGFGFCLTGAWPAAR